MRVARIPLRTICQPAFAGAVWLATISPLHAQQGDTQRAEQLFREGRAAMDQSDLARACSNFAQSHRLEPKMATVVNLAQCEERRGMLLAALARWEEAVRLGETAKDPRVPRAREQMADLGARIPTLTIVVEPSAAADMAVRLDGSVLEPSKLGVPVRVDPGKHRVEVSAPGRAEEVVEVAVAEREKKELRVAPGPPLVEARPPEPPMREEPKPAALADAGAPRTTRTQAPSRPPPSAPEAEPDRTLAYVAGGVGIASLVVAGVTGAMLITRQGRIEAHCDAAKRCDAVGLDAIDSAKGLAPINKVAWVVGVLGLGAGTYLFLTAGSSGDGASGEGRLGPPAGVGVAARGVLP
jgi:hypothetical protein